MKYTFVFIVSMVLFAGQVFAEEKKPIQVKFIITEPQYKNFYEAEIKAIEQQCSLLMIEFLNSTFGFFHFQAGAGESVLQIELADAEQNSGSHSALKEVGFKLTIKPQVKPGDSQSAYWVFRPVERYIEQLPDVREEFVDEIIQTFKLGALNSKEELVKDILSQVEVADDFYFIKEQKMFILPLAEKENNIANFSLFLIITSVPDLVFGTVESYDTTQVFAAIENMQEAVQRFHLPSNYPVGSLALKKLKNGLIELPEESSGTSPVEKKIFILKHVPLPESELEIISPENLLGSVNAD
ncbi:hypothetical protein [Mangrovibacterium lignilyticum]|uniref:hypothetical protein n=1 Tax=Mangrovibacterium lignilyticum TaxID=2668052 RepID=UPI0013D2C4EE|nr:hypothetical protein [Mangrovibacterium lignilyticum]